VRAAATASFAACGEIGERGVIEDVAAELVAIERRELVETAPGPST